LCRTHSRSLFVLERKRLEAPGESRPPDLPPHSGSKSRRQDQSRDEPGLVAGALEAAGLAGEVQHELVQAIAGFCKALDDVEVIAAWDVDDAGAELRPACNHVLGLAVELG
jgi:hypothetical protein